MVFNKWLLLLETFPAWDGDHELCGRFSGVSRISKMGMKTVPTLQSSNEAEMEYLWRLMRRGGKL